MDVSDAADKNAAQATLTDAVRDLAHHHGDGRPLDRVTDHADRLRPHVQAGAIDRVTVVAALTLAAEAACVSRREAEAVIRTELARGAE